MRLEGPLQMKQQEPQEAQEGARVREGAEEQDLAQPQRIFSSARRHSHLQELAQELSSGSAA